MGRSIRIARLFGIDISIHPSWFIILLLIVWSLGAGTFPALYDDWSTAQYWLVAVISALLLFASVLVHELAHSLVALRQGTPVKGITLFFLGGVASIEREATSPGREALMAGAGPLMSIVLGGSFLGLGWAITSPEVLQAIFLYLGLINLVVAAFNLLPGFPLDGGRLLRAAIWAIRGDFVTATRDATRVATVIAVGLMVYGGYMAVTGNLIGGLWLVFIGWIVIQASQASYAQTLTQERLKQVPIRRVMARVHGWVAPAAGLDETEAELAELRARCLPVGSDPEHYDGLICRSDISGLDDGRTGGPSHTSLTAADVMVDREHMPTIAASDPAAEAWQAMTDQKVDRLAVVDDGKLVGFIDRRRLSRYLELHPGGQRPAA